MNTESKELAEPISKAGASSRVQRIETPLSGVIELRPPVHGDGRGFFLETYHRAKFEELGIRNDFVQDNHSLSVKGTLRGLHYQLRQAQAKLCRVVEGEVFDVAVDIRANSPNFGKWTSVILSAELKNELYIPAGFAHGFLALTERVQFLYKCSDYYNPGDEHGIVWDDVDLAIPWPTTAPIVSAKDAKLPALANVPRQFLPEYAQ